MPQQLHACLCRRAPALEAIARDTTGDDVFPILAAALRDRNHVVEGQLRRWQHLMAVLAGIAVTRVNIGARERNVIKAPLDLDEPQQPDDRRKLECELD